MKIRVTFKMADALTYALTDDVVAEYMKERQEKDGDDVEEIEEEEAAGDLEEAMSEYIQYGEYVTVEFDTEKFGAPPILIKVGK